MKFIENHRALIIAGALIFTFSCGCAAGTAGIQKLIESDVASAAEQPDMELGGEESSLSSKAAGEMTELLADDMKLSKAAWEDADYYLEKMPDAPLLAENADPEMAGWAGSSLETDVNDINATNKAGDIIRRFCKANGIDVDKAKVKDLTREQIAQIDMETFRQSEHGA